MKILCELRICTNIQDSYLFKTNQLVNNELRLQQYITGINKFIELNNKNINENIIDVYITDNTISSENTLDKLLLDIIPKNVKIITCINNNYGCFNKGAGDIEQWLYCKDLIKEYDWIIHFEPRQMLLSNQFIDSFIENPRNLFSLGGPYNTKDLNSNYHFNTGLFCIESKLLIEFINGINLHTYKESIEYTFFNFFKNKNYTYDIIDKLDLLWHDSYAQKDYLM